MSGIDEVKFLLLMLQNPKDGSRISVDYKKVGEVIGGMTGNAV